MIETIIALAIAAVITAVALYCLKKKSADPTEGNTPSNTPDASNTDAHEKKNYHDEPSREA